MSIVGIFFLGVVFVGESLASVVRVFLNRWPLLARLCLALASVSGVICLFNEMEKTI